MDSRNFVPANLKVAKLYVENMLLLFSILIFKTSDLWLSSCNENYRTSVRMYRFFAILGISKVAQEMSKQFEKRAVLRNVKRGAWWISCWVEEKASHEKQNRRRDSRQENRATDRVHAADDSSTTRARARARAGPSTGSWSSVGYTVLLIRWDPKVYRCTRVLQHSYARAPTRGLSRPNNRPRPV